MLTFANFGIPVGVTLVQVRPPSWVTLINPSSLPAHRTPLRLGDSARVKTVPMYSMLVLSLVIGPPDGFIMDGSFRVKSGLIFRQLWPISVLAKTNWEQVYSKFGLLGENTIGYVHWKRCSRSSAPCPIGFSGQGSTDRDVLVRWLNQERSPP